MNIENKIPTIDQNIEYEGLNQKGKSPDEMLQFHLSGEADDLTVEFLDKL